MSKFNRNIFSIILKENEIKKLSSIKEDLFDDINRLKLLNVIIFLNRFIIFRKIILSINYFVN